MRLKLIPLSPLICCLLLFACSQESQEVTPTFYQVTIESSSGGTTDLETGKYEEGTSLTITALADDGYIFENWSGDSTSTLTTLTLTVDKNINLKANFITESNFQVPTDNVVLINEESIDQSGYIFAVENGGKACYLIDHNGQLIHEWIFELALGQDAELTPDGNLIGLFKAETSPVGFGGQGGILREIAPDGSILWEYEIATEDEILHHDFTLMPNGNILALVWYRISNEEAVAVGLNNTTDVFMEKVVEINPQSSTVVWEWKSWDHIVQNFNTGLQTYGEPAANKDRINILYSNNDVHEFVAKGDLVHLNGIAYYPDKDIIALSANFYSEVWFIDHSTSTQEATMDSGGQFNKGGRLLYRFGNQKVYGDNDANSDLNFNHHPSFINTNGELSLLIFNNNTSVGQSRVMEFSLPSIDGNSLDIGTELRFDFTDEELYFGRVSGAVRLPNGNTLICEGDYGFWEVTPNGEIVWKYDGNGQGYWRGLYYGQTSMTIVNLLSNL